MKLLELKEKEFEEIKRQKTVENKENSKLKQEIITLKQEVIGL
jgi:NOL1/NOP2/fmu family ribosome biogenesis protein